MAFPKTLKQLCTPAAVYFLISVISMAVVFLQNIGYSDSYHLGTFSCRVPSTIMIFVMKIIYILFWTWVLNLMCKDGHKEIAWFLVLLPFVVLFLLMTIVMMNQ